MKIIGLTVGFCYILIKKRSHRSMETFSQRDWGFTKDCSLFGCFHIFWLKPKWNEVLFSSDGQMT